MFVTSEVSKCNPELYVPSVRLMRYIMFMAARNFVLVCCNCPVIYLIGTGCCWMKKRGHFILMFCGILDIIVLIPLIVMANNARNDHYVEVDKIDRDFDCDDEDVAQKNKV